MSGTAFRIGKVEGQIKELNSRIAKVNPCHESGSGEVLFHFWWWVRWGW